MAKVFLSPSTLAAHCCSDKASVKIVLRELITRIFDLGVRGVELRLNLKIGYLHIKDKVLHFVNASNCAPSKRPLPAVSLNKTMESPETMSEVLPRKASPLSGFRANQTPKQFMGSDIEYITCFRKPTKSVHSEMEGRKRVGYLRGIPLDGLKPVQYRKRRNQRVAKEMSNTAQQTYVEVKNERTFLGSIKEQLLKEREELERKIKEKKSALKAKAEFSSTHKNVKDTFLNDTTPSQYSTESTHSKRSLAYTIGIPTFLKKAKDGAHCRKPNKMHVESSMLTAIERYEKSLEKVRRGKEGTMQGENDKINDWYRISDIQMQKRKLNMKNTQEFLKTQIKENETKQLEERKEDHKWTRTHFGPEETEELIQQRLDTIKQKKAFLNQELKKQIEERAQQREQVKNLELGMDKINLETMERHFKAEIEEQKRAEKEKHKECLEMNKRQKLYRQLASKVADTDSITKI